VSTSDEIAQFKRQYAGKRRAELVEIQDHWVSTAPQWKAAQHLIDDLDVEERRRQSERLRRPHVWVVVGVVAAVLTLLVCVIGYWEQIARLLRAVGVSP